MLENLFTAAIEISLTTAIAVLLITLFSAPAEKRYSAKWRYWVWAVIAVRLMIPFSFDAQKAPIQVDMPRQEMVLTREEAAAEVGAQTEGSADSTSTGLSTDAATGENLSTGTISGAASGETTARPDGQTEIKAPTAAAPSTKQYTFSLTEVGGTVWLFGAAASLIWSLFVYFRFCSRVFPWNRPVTDCEILAIYDGLCGEMEIGKRPGIYTNKLINSPMMTGYIRPRILLPARPFAQQDYGVILRHELTHYKRGDLWYKLLLIGARSVHWFNPVVYMMCRKADDDIEITCDEAVVSRRDDEFRQEYCETILRIMQRGRNHPLMLSTSFYGGAAVLKKRFAAVLNGKAKRGALLFAAAAVLIAFCGSLVACGVGAADVVPDAEQQTSSDGSSESAAEEVCPLPTVTGPDEDGRFPEIEGYLFDRWVTYGEDETEAPDASEITPFIESKYCQKWLAEAYPDIDDWEVLYENDVYTYRDDMYDPYTYSWRGQYAPNRVTVLKTEQGAGFDRLIVVSIDEYAAICSTGGGIIPTAETLCYAIKTTESYIDGGDFSGAEAVGMEQWYPTLWFPAEDRALLLEFNAETVVNVAGLGGEEPPVVSIAYNLSDFLLSDGKTKLKPAAENLNDKILYLKSEKNTADTEYAATVVFYDAETKHIITFEQGEPDNDRSDFYTQIFFVSNNVICLINESRFSLYDITAEPGKPIAVFGGGGTKLSGENVTFEGLVVTDRRFSERCAAIYSDNDSGEFFACTFGTDGALLSDFSLGLKGGSVGSYTYSNGIIYFTYYGSGYYGSVHYSVDARPESSHALQATD